MEISSDYRDLFKTLNADKVRYLVVGAHAVAFYAEPRFTKDLDIWVDCEPANAARLYKALKKFGVPLKGVSCKDFENESTVFQIGVAPVRIDIIMGIEGLFFNEAWKDRVKTKYAGVKINVISKQDLIRSKEKAHRAHDIFDLKQLKKYPNPKKL